MKKAFHETKIYSQNIPIQAFKETNFSFIAHWHLDVELIYVLNGTIQVGINSENRVISKGGFAICGSGDIHFYNSDDPESEVMIVIFRPDLIESFGSWPKFIRFVTPFIDKNQPFYKNISKPTLKRIEKIFKLLITEYEQKQSSYDMFIKGLLYELCGIALRNIPCCSTETKRDSKVFSEIKAIQLALNYLEDNYANDISLDDLAVHVYMSPFHFSRLFRNICGTSFKTYLNTTRINKAETLLSTTDLPIVDIALDCGFNSVRTFNRVFKSIKGKTPSNAR